MYNKEKAGEEGQQGLEGGLQTEGLARRTMFPPSPPATSPEPPSPRLTITVAPFTGGPFEVRVGKGDTIEELKKVIARRLKVAKERIYLLYRESELVEGSIGTNLLVDGSTVTLLPRAETGLISPKPEQSVMQALESLNEQQVNDFLSGAAPLNLTMRLGDHMMLIQLQLSTVNQITTRRKSVVQISSTSPHPAPTFPTPPPSAPSSPPPAPPRKVRVPLLSPGGLIQGSSTLLGASPHPLPSTSSAPLPSTSSAPLPSTSSAPLPSTSAPQPPRQAPTSAPSAPQRSQTSDEPPAKRPKLDPKALAEASKNLTQTLKQLSSEVLTTKPETPGQPTQKPKKEERRKRRATDSKGAIIESMHHHGKGVYSGTFSGTLNPALQDANGQPKRDITTIVHILNDLLCAQFKAYSSSSRSSRHREARAQGAKEPGSFDGQDAAAAREMVERQLEVTRSKVEALRSLMEERKARRVERREAAARAASYSTAWSLTKDCDKEDREFLLPTEPEPCTA